MMNSLLKMTLKSPSGHINSFFHCHRCLQQNIEHKKQPQQYSVITLHSPLKTCTTRCFKYYILGTPYRVWAIECAGQLANVEQYDLQNALTTFPTKPTRSLKKSPKI